MTVHTWCAPERDDFLPIGRPIQKSGTRGKYNKCYAVDVEQTRLYIFVTVAAGSMQECLAEFRQTAVNLDIPAEKWGKFDIPLTENAMRAVHAWADAVRRAIEESSEQARADSSGTF